MEGAGSSPISTAHARSAVVSIGSVGMIATAPAPTSATSAGPGRASCWSAGSRSGITPPPAARSTRSSVASRRLGASLHKPIAGDRSAATASSRKRLIPRSCGGILRAAAWAPSLPCCGASAAWPTSMAISASVTSRRWSRPSWGQTASCDRFTGPMWATCRPARSCSRPLAAEPRSACSSRPTLSASPKGSRPRLPLTSCSAFRPGPRSRPPSWSLRAAARCQAPGHLRRQRLQLCGPESGLHARPPAQPRHRPDHQRQDPGSARDRLARRAVHHEARSMKVNGFIKLERDLVRRNDGTACRSALARC
jgi:hypothetical protein